MNPSQRSHNIPSDRRPEKIRRVLSDINRQERLSPHFKEQELQNKRKMLAKGSQSAPKLGSLTNSAQRQSKLPVFTMSKANREALRTMVSGNNDASEGLNKFLANDTTRSENRNGQYSMVDPEAVRIRKDIERKLLRQIEHERERLQILEKDLKEAKEDCALLSKKKATLESSILNSRNKIDENEITISTLDYKIDLQTKKKAITEEHEAKMSAFKVKEEQNAIMRELDDLKALLEEELTKAHSYEDVESTNEIKRLEEEILQLNHGLKILIEANNERLKRHKDELELKFQESIKEQELHNEKLTKSYELKLAEVDKLAEKVENSKQQIQDLDKSILRIEDEIKEVQYLKQNSLTIELQLLQEIERLKLEESKKLKLLSAAKEANAHTNESYENTVHRFTKEQTVRRKIENSIEELESKLRVYVRVLDGNNDDGSIEIKHDFDHDLRQLLSLNSDHYTVNKVLDQMMDNGEVFKELEIFFQKNLLNGINVSLIVLGYEQRGFIEDTLKNLTWLITKFKEEFQIKFNTTKLDEVTTVDITLQKHHKFYNFTMNIADLTSFSPDNVLRYQESLSSTLSKIKNVQFTKLTKIEDAMTLDERIHFIYSKSKCLTLLNIKDDLPSLQVDLTLLELADILNNIEALHLKRVYNNYKP